MDACLFSFLYLYLCLHLVLCFPYPDFLLFFLLLFLLFFLLFDYIFFILFWLSFSFPFSIFSFWMSFVLSFVSSCSFFYVHNGLFLFSRYHLPFFLIPFLNFLLFSFLCLCCVPFYLHVWNFGTSVFIMHNSKYFSIAVFIHFISAIVFFASPSIEKQTIAFFSVLFVLLLFWCFSQFHIPPLFPSVLCV